MDFAFSILEKEEFIRFNKEENKDVCLDIDEQNYRLRDNDARDIIKKISKCSNATEFQELSQELKAKYIKKLKENGLSIRQISRLTGISKGKVERLL